jgi:hypothetical protein
MPFWVTALKLEIRHFCCRDKFVSIEPDDSCDYWEDAFNESITGKSFNKD